MEQYININYLQFLTNKNIIMASLESRGAVVMLACYAVQNKTFSIENDDNVISKLLNINPEHYKENIKPTILKIFNHNSNEIFIEPLFNRPSGAESRQEIVSKDPITKKKPLDNKSGISLTSLIQEGFDLFNPSVDTQNNKVQPIENKDTKNNKHTIWSIGVTLLSQDDYPENKVRSFLGRLISEYGEQDVASAIASLSLKSISPADGRFILLVY